MQRPHRIGSVAGIRPLAPDDRTALGEMLGRLSKDTIYKRFHTPYPSVPGWMLDHIMGHPGEASLVAVVGEEVVGHAMYAREGGREAEIAVLVEDAWQSRGIGKKLLADLARSAEGRGVHTFTGFALGENRRVLGLVEAVFDGSGRTVKGGSYEIRMPLRGLKSPANIDKEIQTAA